MLDSQAHRRALVDALRRDGHLRSPTVAAALQAVPREVFVPGLPLDEVYRPGDAIVTKRIDGVTVSSASAPEVVALMLEQLELEPGQRVLEIGAGTGYNAALMGHIVGPTGHVVTVDIDADLVEGARAHLAAAGFADVGVVLGDGALGGAERQDTFDRIILTVASSDIAPAWHTQLARPHGRLVLPLSLRGPQRSVAFAVSGDHLHSSSAINCSFITLRGLLATGATPVSLAPDRGCLLAGADAPLPAPVEAIAQRLREPTRALRTGVWVDPAEIRAGLQLWLVAHEPGVYTVWGSARLPDLFGLAERTGARGTLCVIDPPDLVLLGRTDESDDERELLVLAPAAAERLAERVRGRLREWAAAGRPTDADLTIDAYPRDRAPEPAPGQVALDQRWTRFLLQWPARAQPPAILT